MQGRELHGILLVSTSHELLVGQHRSTSLSLGVLAADNHTVSCSVVSRPRHCCMTAVPMPAAN